MPDERQNAPDFSLLDQNGERVELRDFRGRSVVLAFYPADFTPVCRSELALFQEILDDVHDRNAEIIGVSVDSHHCHRRWAEDQNLTFPLVSDFWPHGEVASRYGVLRDDGTSQRSLFFIDGAGVIRDSWIAPDQDVAPGLNLVIEALNRIAGEDSRAAGEDVRRHPHV